MNKLIGCLKGIYPKAFNLKNREKQRGDPLFQTVGFFIILGEQSFLLISDNSISTAEKGGANIINMHHKNELHPFINYL